MFNNQLAPHHQHRNVSHPNPLNKLFCSLMSDLPNEMDFGLRVATILTNSEKIDNLADFRFIDVIIECCILYLCSCEHSAYSKCSDYQFEDEAYINCPNKDELIQKLVDGEEWTGENALDRAIRSVSTKFTTSNVRKFVPFKDCTCFLKFWCQMIKNPELLKMVFDLEDEELERLYDEPFDQEQQQKNYYKVKRIVCLLNNLSYSIEKLRQDQAGDFEELSKVFTGFLDNASINLLRFFILLLNSDDQFFINTALETISNISPLVNSDLPPLDQNTYVRLLTFIYECCVQKVLNSPDVNCLNRCLEIIAKLINANYEAINRLIISEVLSQTEFFSKLTEFLTCQHDVGLVVSTLECCLSLSENYPKLLLTDNKHLVKVLISLINCEEGQFFSMSSMKKVKIIDERRVEISPYLLQQQRQQTHHLQQAHHPQQTFYIQQPNGQISQVSQVGAVGQVGPVGQINAVGQVSQVCPVNQVGPVAPVNQVKQMNVRAIQMNNELTNPAVLADNEQHLKHWFYLNFEPRAASNSSKTLLKLNDMYSDYVKYSCAGARRNVVTLQAFSNLLKKYFPLTVLNAQNEIEGLGHTTERTKASINRVNNLNNVNIIQTGGPVNTNSSLQVITNQSVPVAGNQLASPILKAHLSTPPKSNASNPIGTPSITNSNQPQQQPPPPPQIIVNGPTASKPTASPSIKNLLASKLRNNQIASNTLNSSTSDDHSKSAAQQVALNQPIDPQAKQQTACLVQQPANNIIYCSSAPANASPGQLTNNLANANGPNLITVPMQQQHLVPTSNSMIINANQLQANATGTMMVPNSTGGQQQFLLVRTILPSQNNNMAVGANQQPMRLILPASAFNSQSQLPQTITLNGTNTVVSGSPTMVSCSSTMVSCSPTMVSCSPTMVSCSPTVVSCSPTVVSCSPTVVSKPQITGDDKPMDTNNANQPATENAPIKPAINNSIAEPATATVATVCNASNEQPKPVANNVKASPLLNVLLDKGKLPEFSVVSNDGVQEGSKEATTASAVVSSPPSAISKPIVVATSNAPTNQLPNHIIAHQVSSPSLTASSPAIVSTATSLAPQIVTSTVNTNATKMYILTTNTKSPLTVKSSSSVQTSNTSPVQPIVVQQPNATSPNSITSVVGANQQQPNATSPYVVQSNPAVVSQPMIVQPATSISTTVQNPKLDPPNLPNNNHKLNSLEETILEVSKNISGDLELDEDDDAQPGKVVENCIKQENGEIDESEGKCKLVNEKSIEVNPPVLTNGCLEKEHLENDKESSNSLLKRQLESDDSLCKRPKIDAQITIAQTAIKSEPQLNHKQPPINNQIIAANPVLNSQLTMGKPNEITVAVSSNGILPSPPIISNTVIKSALNVNATIPKTSLPSNMAPTIEKYTISKPNQVIINSNEVVPANNTFKIAQISAQLPPPAPPAPKAEFVCEWSNCKK